MSSYRRKPRGMARVLPAFILAVGTLLFVEEAFSASILQSLVEGDGLIIRGKAILEPSRKSVRGEKT